MRQKILDNWGANLNDATFACAIAALGILSTKAQRAGGRDLVDRLRKADLGNTVTWAAGNSTLVRWRHPASCTSFWKENSLDSAKLADAWPTFRRTRYGVRLIIDASTVAPPPKGVGITGLPALLDVLTHPDAKIDAVFVAWDAQRHAAWDWPLRLGLLDGPASVDFGTCIGTLHPAKTLARTFSFSRRNSHCDVAVLLESPEKHASHIRASSYGERAGLTLFTQGLPNIDADKFVVLEQIAKEMRASGFFTMLGSTGDPSQFVNQVMYNLSHDLPLDVALCFTARQIGTGQPILFLDPGFAKRAQLSAVVTSMTRKLKRAGSAPVTITAGLASRIGTSVGTILPASTAGRALEAKLPEFRFSGESHEATDLAEAKPAVDAAIGSEHSKLRDPRFIQAQVERAGRGVKEQPKAFVIGNRYNVKVRIGPFDDKWLNPTNRTPFPDELLPVDEDEHRLRMSLSEPYHIPAPLVASVTMRSTGASKVAQFRFEPRSGEPSFRGRITVIHRNRILQTALLHASVHAKSEMEGPDDRITVEVEAIVRPALHDLGGRSRFDMVLACDHIPQRQSTLLGLADNHAVLKGMGAISGKIDAISKRLSEVAKTAQRYAKGLDSETGLDLLRFLAAKGHDLYDYLIVDQADPVLGKRLRDADYLQIVSLSPDAYFPAEFIYQFAVPADDAKVCPVALDALKRNDYSTICSVEDHAVSPSPHVCPFGFWGLRRVIERHAWAPVPNAPAGDYVLQAEPSTGRNVLKVANATLFAASNHVNEEQAGAVQTLLNRLRGVFATPLEFAAEWKDWKSFVGKQGPDALIALPHVESKTEPGDTEYYLEIGGDLLKASLIDLSYVKQGASAPSPLVILLGCNTTLPQSAIDSVVGRFRRAGAAIVVGTVASVLGSHSSGVAQEIATQIVTLGTGKAVPFGELLLTARRRAIGRGIVMAMCVGGFGDADWLIKTQGCHQ